jgi:hypothetical protein
VLRASEDQVHGARKRIVFAKTPEIREHYFADWYPGKRQFHQSCGRFLRRTEPDENSDQDEQRIHEQPNQTKYHGKYLPHSSGYSRRLTIVHPTGQQCPEGAASVHRKRWKQVKEQERNVRKQHTKLPGQPSNVHITLEPTSVLCCALSKKAAFENLRDSK